MNTFTKTKKHWPGWVRAWLVLSFFLGVPFAAVAEKKGVAIDGTSAIRIYDLNVSWYQNWKLLPSVHTSPDCFVPMLWGKRGQLEQLPKIFADGNLPKNLLAYNEPDLDTQANRSVQEVVSEWSAVTNYSSRISAPNVAKLNSKWMTDFMSEAQRLDLKVDFLGVHWYGGANARQFLAFIDKLYEQYSLPIWITEFAVADWKSSKYGIPNQYSEQDVVSFLKVVLPELERRSHVEKFAWLAARTNKESLRPSALFDESGRLTTVGEFYANFERSTKCIP